MKEKVSQREIFRDPPARYRGKPFWAWNGNLEEKELLRQIDVFKEMGFGGFFMHSRTGLETEYLGPEWFHSITVCTEYGKKIGMEPWLYDEDRWPSGSAGGLVTRKKEFRASFIQMEKTESEALDWERIIDGSKQIVACYACRIETDGVLEKRKLRSGKKLQKGETALVFSVIPAPLREVYNGNTYLDTMNPEAVQYFIEVTHERYRKKLKAEDLRAITGIFTDEPHRGPLFTNFNGGRENWIPYTPKLFELFEKKYGYDLKEYLPELFLRKSGELLTKVTYQYIELCQELFLENFAVPIQRWCNRYGMKLTGHVLHEDSLSAQTIMQGSLMRFYEYMDIPGIDQLLRDNYAYWIVKQVASAAKQLGKKQVLSELYGATGWKTTLEEYKQMGDWQAVLGINFRCPHLAWYTMKGEAKRDYPASISYHLSGWKEYRYLEDYFSRMNVFMEMGCEKEDVLVICPVESVWARSCSGAFDGQIPRDDVINQIENTYKELFWILTENQIGFDYGEETLMQRYGRVKDGYFELGGCRYKKILVCGMLTMRNSTLQLLKEFRKSGGSVVFAGKLPGYVDAERSDEVIRLAGTSIRIPFEEQAVVQECMKEKIAVVSGEGRKDILVSRREDETGINYILLNKNRFKSYQNICIRFDGTTLHDCMEIQEWNARTGEILALLPEKENDGSIKMVFSLAQGEEKLLRFSRNNVKEDEKNKIVCIEKNPLSVPGKYFYRLSEKNICVLDQVTAKFSYGDGKEYLITPKEVLRADREFRKILGRPMRGGDMLQPWYQKKFSQRKQARHKVSLCHEFRAEELPDRMELALENTEHISNIRLNGTSIQLKFGGRWIDECMKKIQLPLELLKIGVNEIIVDQEFEGEDGFESVYLLGDFSVWLDEGKYPVIKRLPEMIKPGDVTKQGFPFYSGEITYYIPDVPHEEVQLKVGEWKGWTITVTDADGKDYFLGFAPYTVICNGLKEIHLFLTRKNTFGPLHEANPDPGVCEPDSFLTEGQNWLDCYVLQAQGLQHIQIKSSKKNKKERGD